MNKSIILVCNKFVVHNNAISKIFPFSTSTVNNLIQKYRKEQGLPMNPNTYGSLTDLPDYSYLDGRPTPLGMNQKRRMRKQNEIAQKIITLSKEMDFAKQRHADMAKADQQKNDSILANKLKPKGHLLKSSKSNNC